MKQSLRKRKGALMVLAMLIMLLVFTLALSFTALSISNSENIGQGTKKSQLYYLSKSGLEIAYGALNTKIESGRFDYLGLIQQKASEKNPIYKKLGWESNDKGLKMIIAPNIEIKKGSGDRAGYVTVIMVALDNPGSDYCKGFGVTNKKESYLYKVVSIASKEKIQVDEKTGKLKQDSVSDLNDVYTLSMTVKSGSSRDIEYYNGDI